MKNNRKHIPEISKISEISKNSKMPKIVAYSGTHGTGKTTSALQLATDLKIYYPTKSVHILCDLEAFCPYPINKETCEKTQAWLFAHHLQQLLTAVQRFDIVVLDTTLADIVAYSYVAGFTGQAESMMQFFIYHINYYSEIHVKAIQDNAFWYPDGIRDAKDIDFRQQVEDALIDIYTRIEEEAVFSGALYYERPQT